MSDGARFVCSPAAVHSVFGSLVGEDSSVGRTFTSSEATHSEGVISSFFAPQLERKSEIVSIVERSIGVVFFISNEF